MICSSGRTIVLATGISLPFNVDGTRNRNHHPINATARRRSPMRSISSPLVLTPGTSALFSTRELNRFVTVIQTKEVKQRKRNVVCCISPSPTPQPTKTVVVDDEVAVRRGLAMRRVLEDNGGDGSSVRDFSFFTTERGDTLFTQSWTRVGSVKNRGIVVLLHGLNEHSGRYNDFAKQLNVNGFKVYGIDWIGHGGSDGLHAYVPSLDYAVTDLSSFLEKVIAENPGLPCFCVGHSTGGAIILKAMLDPKIEAQVSGIVLTSPAVGVQPSHPIFGVIAPFLAFLIPRYQLSAAKKKIMPVSRDPEALLAKYSDPLVYTGFIRARTGYEILRLGSHLLENLNRIKVPFLVLHGTADTVTDPKATQRLYDEASSSDKSIKLFDGLLHDLLFEPERGIIAGDIDDVSLLVLLLDTNPLFWDTTSTTFSQFLSHVLAFLNAVLGLNQLNQVVVIATGYSSCDYVYDSSLTSNVRSESRGAGMPALFGSLLEKMEDFIGRDAELAEGDEHVDRIASSLLSGSLSMALCYIQRVFRSGHLHPQPRILCLQGSPDGPEQYVLLYNLFLLAIFSYVCLVPIDSCYIGTQNSAFLQQASYITGGVHHAPKQLDGLFQFLTTIFATDLHTRGFVQLPKPVGVDFRASCFCHKKTIDMGYVCSVCLSIFCEHHKKCSTCG
ncbi:unnamed protein product [Brassica oleracea]